MARSGERRDAIGGHVVLDRHVVDRPATLVHLAGEVEPSRSLRRHARRAEVVGLDAANQPEKVGGGERPAVASFMVMGADPTSQLGDGRAALLIDRTPDLPSRCPASDAQVHLIVAPVERGARGGR